MKKIYLLLFHGLLSWLFSFVLGVITLSFLWTDSHNIFRYYLGNALATGSLFLAAFFSAQIVRKLMHFDKKDSQFVLIFGTLILFLLYTLPIFIGRLPGIESSSSVIIIINSILVSLSYFLGTLFLKPSRVTDVDNSMES